MKRILLFFVLCLSLAGGGALAEPSATAVRIGIHPDKTRFVLELSEEPRYRVFTLADPFRVVIDLPALEWKLGDEPLGGRQGVIEALRFGLFAPGTSRVVLDVDRPVDLKAVFVLPPRDGQGHRLVVDLAPISREAFLDPIQRQPVVSKSPLPMPRSRPQAATPKVESDQRPLIVIDAGHGGVDPGAKGVSGTYEKHVALAFARELESQLMATGRYRVVLTRDEDIFIRLKDRVAIAQEAGGDLFISLHANNHQLSKLRGASVYTLSETASDKEAEALAAKENKADIIGGIDLSEQTEVVSKILIDLAQRETMNLSKQFANSLVEALGQTTKLLRNSHRSAGFAVLKSPIVPSVLVEIGYMSNKEEERILRSKRHQVRLSKSMVEAIERYFAWQESLKRS